MDYHDSVLFERIRQGDEVAFEQLFRSYYTSLCLFSQRIVRDAVAAEEIVQDIFIYFWEKREQLQFNISLRAYLFRSAYNNSLKYLRHQKIVHDYESAVKSSDTPLYELPDNYAETGEVMHIIHQTLEQLPERSREIFELNRFDGFKYLEIAEKLKISVKTVEAHMSSVLKLFRENLKDYLMVFYIVLCFWIG